jgi:hypothetical protein
MRLAPFLMLLAVGCDRIAFAGVVETTREELKVAGAPRIVVDSDGGSIEVRAGGDGVVKVEARRHAPTAKEALALKVTIQQENGVVKISYTGERNRPNRSVSFVIQAPAGSRTELATDGGSVKVEGFTADVSATTDGGSITVAQVRAKLKLHTGGGSITLSQIDGTVDATTDGGSITCAGTLRGDNRLTTDGGSIAVTLPADARLKVDASTGGGSARNDFDLPVSRGDGSARFKGSIGDGSAGTLHLATEGGSVSLRKG